MKYKNNNKDKNILVNKNNNIFYNYLNNFVLVNKFNQKWNIFFDFFLFYFKKYNYSNSIINIIKIIQSNKNLLLIIFFILSWFWSSLLLNLMCSFMLIDSIIISLLVLQNNSVNQNSRRLCKNIILIALTSLGLIGGMITLFLITFVYLEYSKFINRILFKIIKFIIKLVGGIFPPIYLFYPDIQLFNFDDPDNTIISRSKSECTIVRKPNNITEQSTKYNHIKNIKYSNFNKHNNKNIVKKKNKILHTNYSSESSESSESIDTSDTSDTSDMSESIDTLEYPDILNRNKNKSSHTPTISKINSEIIKQQIKNIKLSNNNFKKSHPMKKNNKKFDFSNSLDNNDLSILNKFGL